MRLLFCTECGDRIADGATFCGNCGVASNRGAATGAPCNREASLADAVEAKVQTPKAEEQPSEIRIRTFHPGSGGRTVLILVGIASALTGWLILLLIGCA